MAVSPSTIRVTNDYVADEIEAAGKRLIELSMRLREGFDVPVEYGTPPAGQVPRIEPLNPELFWDRWNVYAYRSDGAEHAAFMAGWRSVE